MDLLTTSEKAKEWGISNRRVQLLASNGRIKGAQKIGGVWLIPALSCKPTTDTSEKKDYYYKTIKNRSKLKSILKSIYSSVSSDINADEIRRLIISALNASILYELLSNKETVSSYELANITYNFLGGKEDISQESFKLMYGDFHEYVRETNGDLLNTLSWTYQYLNAIIVTNDNKFSNTQFFTEQYMIDYLLDETEKSYSDGIIFDPCCGGGNMLTAALQKVFLSRGNQSFASLQRIVEQIVGFDVDPFLIRVAVLNIRAKGIELISMTGQIASFNMWQNLNPKLYSQIYDNIEGSLGNDIEIIDAVSKKKGNIKQFHGVCEIVITNPPFATVKGMNKNLNIYLKKNYPLSNSDLSASFILKCGRFLKPKGTALMVVQNSWMFLDSFTNFRINVLSNYCFSEILDLGSGAFLDLSGEKSSVALIKFCHFNISNEIEYVSLKNRTIENKINGLLSQSFQVHYLKQSAILQNDKSRFDVLNIGTIKDFYYSGESVANYATPMQGTSTGNNKELVGYFWEHFGEKSWKLVSKGGAYSRWQGLNRYVVKWGENGEFIKLQKGSAIRNVKYFDQTELVFSDTGTSGLNVRVMLENQFFIASGPGIRVHKGNKYALLALLNSRLSSYYLRILSPKLTIAAGYIAKIPINSEIANSTYLIAQAQICLNTKKLLLMNRPNNYEFSFEIMDSFQGSFQNIISNLIVNEMKLELQKLEAEGNIERYIFGKANISKKDIKYIWEELGRPVDTLVTDKLPQIKDIDRLWYASSDSAVYLSKNKSERHHMGSDGIVEFLSQKYQINPTEFVKFVEENILNISQVRDKYKDLLLHNSILQFMDYRTSSGPSKQSIGIEEVANFITERFDIDFNPIIWIKLQFEIVHFGIFFGKPFLKVSDDRSRIERI